ncbi:MAG TPA: hypothetical protein VFZ09_27570 [Archangium sp.]|uniref:hypothetical protein n=1 Tax=Archangium sp. TaxID=1872627 RepID=UPI002E316B8A|nr:hypothetical protein [Archangium sp.]HEX5750020.1 hypothetical protein [Archangium sp.]
MSLWAGDMRETFHIKRNLGPDSTNPDPRLRMVERYGPAEPHPCRWQPGARLVKAADGRQVVSEGTLFTTARFTSKDLLWLPGEDPEDVGASKRALRAWERKALETGDFDHTEAAL